MKITCGTCKETFRLRREDVRYWPDSCVPTLIQGIFHCPHCEDRLMRFTGDLPEAWIEDIPVKGWIESLPFYHDSLHIHDIPQRNNCISRKELFKQLTPEVKKKSFWSRFFERHHSQGV